jgi:hypothetical protein
MGGIAIGQGSHDLVGTKDSTMLPERLPPALHSVLRQSIQAVHRHHRDDVRGEQERIEVSGDLGRAAAPTSVVPTPRVGVGNTSSAIGAQPIR